MIPGCSNVTHSSEYVQTLPPSTGVIPSDVHEAGISEITQPLLPPQLTVNSSDIVKITAAPIRIRYVFFTIPLLVKKYFGILIHVLQKGQGVGYPFFLNQDLNPNKSFVLLEVSLI